MDQLIWNHIMRAKSVARKLANSININTDNDNGNDNGNGNVNIGTSLAYKGKVLELQLFYLHHGTVPIGTLSH